jgi:hypothetical protein
MGRGSHLYDLINGLTIDAICAPYKTGERDLAIEHFERLRTLLSTKDLQRVLVIFDRGYPSAALIVYLLKHGINFLMRCNKKFIKEIDRAVATGKKDVIVNFSVNRSGQAKEELQKLFPDLNKKERVSVRVIIVTLETDEKEILITSLLDTKEYLYQIFSQLYFKRWGIEENFKFHKIELEIENFSGKSCLMVEQDFHATVLAANARALLALEATNERTKHQEDFPNVDRKKYIYAINKKISMEAFKNEFVAVLLDPDADIEHFCFEAKKIMKLNLIPIRPNRHFQRIRKHARHKYPMNRR